MDEYNAIMNGDNPIKIPAGIKITRVSETLVTYTLPKENGLSIKGIVVYGVDEGDSDEDAYFAEMKFAFPKDESQVEDFLMRYYIKQMQE